MFFKVLLPLIYIDKKLFTKAKSLKFLKHKNRRVVN